MSETTTTEHQVGGEHYRRLGDYQPWLVLRHWLTTEQLTGYLLGSAVAYLGRFNATEPGKGGIEDVRKAIHTLKYLEGILTAEHATATSDPTLQERGMYYSHSAAIGQACRIQQRDGNRLFVRPDRGGGGFWTEAYKVVLAKPPAGGGSSPAVEEEPLERAIYRPAACAKGQPVTVLCRHEGQAFVKRLDGLGDGFWIPADKLISPADDALAFVERHHLAPVDTAPDDDAAATDDDLK